VVFLHGWSGMIPSYYGAWIQHLVRKGHIVVFPRYQAALLSPLAGLLPAAQTAVVDAWDWVNAEGPVAPEGGAIVWVGHSLGGVFATILAARSSQIGLPPPAAVLSVEPGGEGFYPDDLGDIGLMPMATRVLLVVGEEDETVGSAGARTLARRMVHMPPENVELVTVQSDRRALPPLVADHMSPLAIVDNFTGSSEGRIQFTGLIRLRLDALHKPDALDFFAYWKLSDGLLDGSFRGRNLDYAFGDTEEQRFMGYLSDGTPVAPLRVRRPLEPLDGAN
jgi:pimeloyl-ACP methyl ester carboxylesterase